MKRVIILLVNVCLASPIFSQEGMEIEGRFFNTAERLLMTEGRLTIGGYGEVHYNQPIEKSTLSNGKLDVHRIVMLFGYNFNERTSFITEIEYEHVKEVYIEQAFLQYRLNSMLNFRAGLLLIPMGIINEYHEPAVFNGVERPLIDQNISPTTWREIGAGITGTFLPISLKYQVYVVNGFSSFADEAKLSGNNGLRGGRQKGAESFMSSPNFTGKIDFFGVRGLNVGLSLYAGNTQSTLYNGLDKSDEEALARADSSVVGVIMTGADFRYSISGFRFRGQYYLASLDNTDQYNAFTSSNGEINDLGSRLSGFYIEGAWNVLDLMPSTGSELFPFVRYSSYNTHAQVEGSLDTNPSYKREVITAGLTWKPATGAVFKSDIQWFSDDNGEKARLLFNAGIGVMF